MVILITLWSVEAFGWQDEGVKCKKPRSGSIHHNFKINNTATATSTSTATATGGAGGAGGSVVNNISIDSSGSGRNPNLDNGANGNVTVDPKTFRQFPAANLPDAPPLITYSGPNVIGFNAIEDWTLFPEVVTRPTADTMDPDDIWTEFRRIAPTPPENRMTAVCRHIRVKPTEGYVVGFTFGETGKTSADLFGAVSKDCMRAGANGFWVVRKVVNWKNVSSSVRTGLSAMLSFLFGGSGVAGASASAIVDKTKGEANMATFPGVVVAHIWIPPKDGGITPDQQPYLNKDDEIKVKEKDLIKLDKHE